MHICNACNIKNEMRFQCQAVDSVKLGVEQNSLMAELAKCKTVSEEHRHVNSQSPDAEAEKLANGNTSMQIPNKLKP